MSFVLADVTFPHLLMLRTFALLSSLGSCLQIRLKAPHFSSAAFALIVWLDGRFWVGSQSLSSLRGS